MVGRCLAAVGCGFRYCSPVVGGMSRRFGFRLLIWPTRHPVARCNIRIAVPHAAWARSAGVSPTQMGGRASFCLVLARAWRRRFKRLRGAVGITRDGRAQEVQCFPATWDASHRRMVECRNARTSRALVRVHGR